MPASVVDINNPTFAMGPSPMYESADGAGASTFTSVPAGGGGNTPMYDSAPAVGSVGPRPTYASAEAVNGVAAAPRGSVVYGSASDTGPAGTGPASPTAVYATVHKNSKSDTVTSVGSAYTGFADGAGNPPDPAGPPAADYGFSKPQSTADYGFSNAAADPDYASAGSLTRTRANPTGSGARVLMLDQTPAYYDAPATNAAGNSSAAMYATVPELMDENAPAPRFVQPAAQFATLPLWFHKAGRAEAEARIKAATNNDAAAATVRYLVRPAGAGAGQNGGANAISYFVAGKFWHKRFRLDPATATFRYTTARQQNVALGATLHESVPVMLGLLANEAPRFSAADLVPVDAIADVTDA